MPGKPPPLVLYDDKVRSAISTWRQDLEGASKNLVSLVESSTGEEKEEGSVSACLSAIVSQIGIQLVGRSPEDFDALAALYALIVEGLEKSSKREQIRTKVVRRGWLLGPPTPSGPVRLGGEALLEHLSVWMGQYMVGKNIVWDGTPEDGYEGLAPTLWNDVARNSLVLARLFAWPLSQSRKSSPSFEESTGSSQETTANPGHLLLCDAMWRHVQDVIIKTLFTSWGGVKAGGWVSLTVLFLFAGSQIRHHLKHRRPGKGKYLWMWYESDDGAMYASRDEEWEWEEVVNTIQATKEIDLCIYETRSIPWEIRRSLSLLVDHVGDGQAGMCEDWNVNRFPEGPWFTSQFDDPKCSLEPAWTSSTADQSDATSSPQDRTFESIAERRQALLAEDDREYFDTMGEDLDPDWQETWDELCAVCGVRERPNIQRMFSRQFVNKMQLGDGEGYARRLEYCQRLARQVMNSNGQVQPSDGEVKDLVEILMRTVQPALAVDFDLSKPVSHPKTPPQLKGWATCETPFPVLSSRFRLEEWSRCRTSVAIGHVSRSRTQETSETNDHPPAQERTPKVSRFFEDGKWFFEPGWDVQVHRVRGCKSETASISCFQWALVPTDGVDADIHPDGAKHTGAGTTEREERLAHNEIQVGGGTSLNFWCHEGCWLYLRAWLTEQMDKRKVGFPGQFRPTALNGERVTNRGRDESDTVMSFAGEFYEIVNSSKRGKVYGVPGDIYPGPIVDQCDPLQEGFEKRFLANGGRMSRVGRRYLKDRANVDPEALLDDWSLDLGAWQCHDPTIWPSTPLVPERGTIRTESTPPTCTQKIIHADTKFSLLPPEILESVLLTLDLCDIFLFSRTCRSIYTLVHSQLDSLIKLRICDKEAEHSLFWIMPVLQEEVSSFVDSLGKDDERSEKFRAIRSASREEVEVVEDGPDSKTIVSHHTLHLDSDAHPCPPDLLAEHDILSYFPDSSEFSYLKYLSVIWRDPSMMNRRRIWNIVKQYDGLWRRYRSKGWEEDRFSGWNGDPELAGRDR